MRILLAFLIMSLALWLALSILLSEPDNTETVHNETIWLGHPVVVPEEDCDHEATECVPGIYDKVEIGLMDNGAVVWRPHGDKSKSHDALEPASYPGLHAGR